MLELLLILAPLLFLVVIVAVLWQQERRANHISQKYSGIVDAEGYAAEVRSNAEAHRDKVNAEIELQVTSAARARNELAELNAQLQEKQRLVIDLDQRLDLQEMGFYQSAYPDLTSQDIRAKLIENREKQKAAIQLKQAIICRAEWSVDGSAAKGRKLVDEQVKLMLRAFNGECDSAIARVKYNNASKMLQKIERAYASINKMAATKQCEITDLFLKLKLNELRLQHEFEEREQEERDEQRRIQEQMREVERAQRELDRAKEQAEKEEHKFEVALQLARTELLSAADAERNELMEKIATLTAKLQKATEVRRTAVSRAEMTRTGHIYIISNLGSFGDNVFKIGLTRRLEPMERVRELGDASVPFNFDVHAIIYSDDAPGLERMLHTELAAKQINKVNPRKEFFKTTLAEIEQLVSRYHRGGEVRWTRLAEARQYRETLAIEKQSNNGVKEYVLAAPLANACELQQTFAAVS